MRASFRPHRLRLWLVPGTLLLLLTIALVPADGMLLETTLVLVLPLAAAVATQYRLERQLPDPERARRPALASPLDIGVALTVVIAIGALVAVVTALLLSVLAKVGGDGRSLLKVLIAAFALAPCLTIGARCGRWWAFSGSLLLVPVSGISVLIVGPRGGRGVADVLFVVVATSLMVAVGSLQHRLQSVPVRRRTLPRPRTVPAASTAATPPTDQPACQSRF